VTAPSLRSGTRSFSTVRRRKCAAGLNDHLVRIRYTSPIPPDPNRRTIVNPAKLEPAANGMRGMLSTGRYKVSETEWRIVVANVERSINVGD
jgi:hypothetical protein